MFRGAVFNASCGNVTHGEMEAISEADVYFHYTLYNILSPALFVCIIVAGTVGNITVAAVILGKKKMRTPVNLLLLNLAFADLAFLWLGVSFITYHFAAASWMLGDVMCKMSHYVLDVTCYVVVYTLIIIAAVRYVLVVRWRQMASQVTCRVALAAIVCIWLVSLGANVPVLALFQLKIFPSLEMYNAGTVRVGIGTAATSEEYTSDPTPPYLYCAMSSVEQGQRLNFIFFAFAYALPLFVICCLYCFITRYIRAHHQDSAYHHVDDTVSTDRHGAIRKRHLHAVRLLAVVVAVFALTRLPLHIHLFIAYLGQTSNTAAYQIYRLVAHFVSYSNSFTNPIIYNYVSTDFQQSFKELYSLRGLRLRRSNSRLN